MKLIEPQRDFKDIPKSLLVIGCLYFSYEIALLYFGLWPDTGVFLPPERATLLRDANHLARNYIYMAFFFLVCTVWHLFVLRLFIFTLLTLRATFLALWYTPTTLEAAFLEVVLPLALLGAMALLSFRFPQPAQRAP